MTCSYKLVTLNEAPVGEADLLVCGKQASRCSSSGIGPPLFSEPGKHSAPSVLPFLKKCDTVPQNNYAGKGGEIPVSPNRCGERRPSRRFCDTDPFTRSPVSATVWHRTGPRGEYALCPASRPVPADPRRSRHLQVPGRSRQLDDPGLLRPAACRPQGIAVPALAAGSPASGIGPQCRPRQARTLLFPSGPAGLVLRQRGRTAQDLRRTAASPSQ